MHKHLVSFAYFCGAYIVISLALIIVSVMLSRFAGFDLPHSGIMAAAVAALIAGQIYATHAHKRPSGVESTLQALAMGLFVVAGALIQMRLTGAQAGSGEFNPLMTEVIIPILLILHFVILRVCFPVGARNALKKATGVA